MKSDFKPPAKTYGYDRSREVPGGNPKVCKTCNNWFAARPWEAICDGCVPAKTRVKRLAQATTRGSTVEAPKPAAQQGCESGFLGVVFGPGVPLWKVLASEAAAWADADPTVRSSRPPWDGAQHLYRDAPVPRGGSLT